MSETHKLRSRQLHPQLFRQPFADFLRQPVMHVASAETCRIDNGHWGRGSNCNRQPDDRRQREASQGCEFQYQRVTRLEMMNDTKGQQEYCSRERGEDYQANINPAMQLLARMATLAGGEMLFVVAAHFRRKAGNVVPPARQNLAYHGINAIAHTS